MLSSEKDRHHLVDMIIPVLDAVSHGIAGPAEENDVFPRCCESNPIVRVHLVKLLQPFHSSLYGGM